MANVPESVPAQVVAPGEVAAAPPAKGKGKAVVRRVIFLVVLAAAATGGLIYWLHSRHFEETDDAQIDGTIANISPRISGTVKDIFVSDNQLVHAGEALCTIDAIDYDVALAQAKANLALAEASLKAEDPQVPMIESTNDAARKTADADLSSAEAALASSQREVKQLSAQIAQAEANQKTAQLERDRSAALVATGTVSQSDFDTKDNTLKAAIANTDAIRESHAGAVARVAEQTARILQARAHLGELRANTPRQLETRKANVRAREASLELARAQVHQAELNVEYTRVVAPVGGVVGRKSIALGDHVAPGQVIMVISQTDNLWVTANFRESQLRLMQVGQPVRVHVDALGEDFDASVESFAGATGSRFSLLPPENASGNYVKVVQRVPVRIRFDEGQEGLENLRLGMSVEPQVRVR